MSNFAIGKPINFMPELDGFNLTIPDYAGRLQAQLDASRSTTGPKKRSFFSKDSAFWDVLGVVGDGLSGGNTYASSIQQSRQAEEDEARWQRRRQEQMEDWLRRRQAESEYPSYNLYGHESR